MQKMAEAEELEAIERERARRRMLSGKSVEPSGNISLGSKGETRSSETVEMFPPQKQGMEIFPHPESKSC